jgi:hypothetical protein
VCQAVATHAVEVATHAVEVATHVVEVATHVVEVATHAVEVATRAGGRVQGSIRRPPTAGCSRSRALDWLHSSDFREFPPMA